MARIEKARWSVETVKAQILGELNYNPNSTSEAPDRIGHLVILSLRDIWTDFDWQFQLRLGALTAAAGDTSAVLPEDFGEMHSWSVKDEDESEELRFTKNSNQWLALKQGYKSTDTGHPELGWICRDMDDADEMVWKVKFEIASDAAYSWPFIYKADCPIDLPSTDAGTYASYTTALDGSDNDLTYTAVAEGTSGNSITIAYTAGGTAGSEVVTVTSSAISVQVEATVSTAAQVKTAIEASVAASALVSIAYATGQDGTGAIPAALSAKSLSGGGSHADFKAEGKMIPMPTAMHTLWYLKALYRCQRAFRKGEAWKDTRDEYERELKKARVEKDAPLTETMDPLLDGYQDDDALLGAGGMIRPSDVGRLPST